MPGKPLAEGASVRCFFAAYWVVMAIGSAGKVESASRSRQSWAEMVGNQPSGQKVGNRESGSEWDFSERELQAKAVHSSVVRELLVVLIGLKICWCL